VKNRSHLSHIPTSATKRQTRRSSISDVASVKTAFHYSLQLQTWSKTWSQAGRKHVESQLRTCLKQVFYSTCLACARTSEPTAVRDQVFGKKSRKLVESVSQTRTNLSKTWLCCKPGLQPGLQMARIMECGLYRTSAVGTK